MSGKELEAEDADDPLVPIGEDELANLDSENEGVVFLITTSQQQLKQSRKSRQNFFLVKKMFLIFFSSKSLCAVIKPFLSMVHLLLEKIKHFLE